VIPIAGGKPAAFEWREGDEEERKTGNSMGEVWELDLGGGLHILRRGKGYFSEGEERESWLPRKREEGRKKTNRNPFPRKKGRKKKKLCLNRKEESLLGKEEESKLERGLPVSRRERASHTEPKGEEGRSDLAPIKKGKKKKREEREKRREKFSLHRGGGGLSWKSTGKGGKTRSQWEGRPSLGERKYINFKNEKGGDCLGSQNGERRENVYQPGKKEKNHD